MDRRTSPPTSFNNWDQRECPPDQSHRMSHSSFTSRGPLPIPSQPVMHTVPPPLPPPTHIRELETGYDAGWRYANSSRATTHLPPLNSNSSLLGGHRRADVIPHSDSMDIDELDGRQNRTQSSHSSGAQIRVQPPPLTNEGFPNSISVLPTGAVLKGEQNFSLRSVKDSSNAYDQHLLSKIGNSLSPRNSISQGSDHRGSISTLTVPSISSRASSNLPSPGALDAGSILDLKWLPSPQADAVSPRSKSHWLDRFEGRSPSEDSNTPSAIFDHDGMREGGRRRYQGTTPSREDSISLPSHSHRGSYDLGVFSDYENESQADESARPRQFILREPTPPFRDGTKLGMKRRASSPPREPMGESLHLMTNNGDLSQRRTSGQPFANTLSVNTSYPSSRRALSASSSLSIRTSGSYSSTLSIGGSSMTSLSPYDRLSPGGLSSCSDLDVYHEKSILNTNPPASLVQALPRPINIPSSLEPPVIDSAGKVNLPNVFSVPRISHGSKISGLYICDCCPKKPKKFDNPEDLRSHEMEKQYSCQYCNNRFKNKNEAERHQNSLHLRRYSWSCAALPSFKAAFRASSSPSCQTSAGPSHDSCGYCGKEFSNFPRPDWDGRFEHLTTLHKFGECNNAKKFFRADHFRQHLKHSHAGSSGKWTNILENACMKEEQPPEPRDKARNVSGSQKSGPLPTDIIDEVIREE